jgi:hypothetical protein
MSVWVEQIKHGRVHMANQTKTDGLVVVSKNKRALFVCKLPGLASRGTATDGRRRTYCCPLPNMCRPRCNCCVIGVISTVPPSINTPNKNYHSDFFFFLDQTV